MTELPPLDQPLAWVVVHGNEQAGPYTLNLLIDEVVAGRLVESTPVWWPPLSDWTTIETSVPLTAEIASRRATVAPAWASPVPSSAPSPQQPHAPEQAPSSQQPHAPEQAPSQATGASQPSGFIREADPVYEPSPSASPAVEGPAPVAEAAPTQQPAPVQQQSSVFVPEDVDRPTISDESGYAAGSFNRGSDYTDSDYTNEESFDSSEADIVEAEVVSVIEAVPSSAAEDDGQPEAALSVGGQPEDDQSGTVPSALVGTVRADFSDLVARSRVLAERRDLVAGIDELFVNEVVQTALDSGFAMDERVDVEHRHELRFSNPSTADELVVSLTQIEAAGHEDVPAIVLPITTTVRTRAGQQTSGRPEVAGEHGQIAVKLDDWTGQVTSSVSLLLAVGDYLDADLAADRDRLRRDFRSVIESLRSALDH